MLYVDIPSLSDLQNLNEVRADACVSLYVPTTPVTQDVEASRVAAGNLAKQAYEQLEAAGLDKRRLGPDTYGIVDEITGRALMSGGRVIAARKEDIPGGGSLAATLRYPL